uniref:Variant surface glycoprotein 561 n=1 Tax=Trypanosoma brucei TaxID=5691 RepID=M4SYD6_9TRYP|nr:variant surface glycoprotein 561 [Trypanosoma brucei]
MNGNMALSLVLLVALSLSTSVSADSAEATKANKAVTNACQEAELLQHLIEETESRISTVTTEEDGITEEAQKFFLGAARSAGTARYWQYMALQLAAEQIAAENKKNKATAATLKDVLQTLLRRQAQVKLYHKMSDGAEHKNGISKAKGIQSAFLTTGTPRMCVVEFAAKDPNTGRCRKPVSATKDIDKIRQNVAAADGITGLPGSAFKRPKITAIAEATGSPAGEDHNSASEVCKSGGNGAAGSNNVLAVSAIKLDNSEATPTKATISRPAASATGCKEPEVAPEELLVTQEQVTAALCKLQDAKPTGPTTIGQLTLTALQDNPTLQKIAMLITGDPNAEADTNTMKATVKALFGESTETMEKTYLEPLTTVSIQFKVAKAQKKGTIVSFATDSGYSEALANLLGQDFKASKVKQAQATAAAKPAIEKCKEDTTEKEFKKDKDCEFKDGKCKLKEGVKKENDGKVENNTGSNSIVINRAALLFAFFLL